jgi:molecular chaperone DnaK (HSP70)
VDRARAAYLPYEFVATPKGSVGVKRAGDEVLTVEEAQAMLFGHVKSISSVAASGAEVRDCVITVPAFFSQKERRAMVDAAELGGLNVLGLINENTAAALQYAINYEFNANKTTHAIFYNMGASYTQVSLVRFSSENVKGKPTRTLCPYHHACSNMPFISPLIICALLDSPCGGAGPRLERNPGRPHFRPPRH